MTDTLALYRDDGPLARAVMAAVSRGTQPARHRLAWLVPPLLRAVEYGGIAVLGWRAGASGLGATYALLAAMAFRHYDIVYRLRHQAAPPPAWVGTAGLGWDGRVVVVLAAALTDVYVPTAIGLAVWCGALFVAESVTSWVRVARDPTRTVAMATGDDEE
ncbi:MAG: hypothetical protein GEU74_01665 [Nitriliruptorales bacterium]|nr:hypothetical protein [Nitriliruptorales bacterium]